MTTNPWKDFTYITFMSKERTISKDSEIVVELTFLLTFGADIHQIAMRWLSEGIRSHKFWQF